MEMNSLIFLIKITLFGSKDFDSLEYKCNGFLGCFKLMYLGVDIKDYVVIPHKYYFI